MALDDFWINSSKDERTILGASGTSLVHLPLQNSDSATNYLKQISIEDIRLPQFRPTALVGEQELRNPAYLLVVSVLDSVVPGRFLHEQLNHAMAFQILCLGYLNVGQGQKLGRSVMAELGRTAHNYNFIQQHHRKMMQRELDAFVSLFLEGLENFERNKNIVINDLMDYKRRYGGEKVRRNPRYR